MQEGTHPQLSRLYPASIVKVKVLLIISESLRSDEGKGGRQQKSFTIICQSLALCLVLTTQYHYINSLVNS